MQRQKTLALTLIIAVLAGCHSSTKYVPVYSAGETRVSGANLYIVQKGDTLYSIAFRYGLDYKDLARANNIHPPYTIYIDQRIRVAGETGASQGAAVASTAKPTQKDSAAKPAIQTPTTVTNVKPPPPINTPKVADSNINWHWPYDGEVVLGFSLSGKVNKGIDIRGKIGDSVRSSADGVVVYAGGGLRGYGKLVIVKHNDRYLSAYGHNEAILVKEGDEVKGGQAVAKIGGTNGDQDLLHFEIRRDGKPEDPLQYLPPRSRGD